MTNKYKIILGCFAVLLVSFVLLLSYRIYNLDHVVLVDRYSKAVKERLGASFTFFPKVDIKILPLPHAVFSSGVIRVNENSKKEVVTRVDRLSVSIDLVDFLLYGRISSSSATMTGVKSDIPVDAVFSFIPDNKEVKAKSSAIYDGDGTKDDELFIRNFFKDLEINQMEFRFLKGTTFVGNVLLNKIKITENKNKQYSWDLEGAWEGEELSATGESSDIASFFANNVDSPPWKIDAQIALAGVMSTVSGQIDNPHRLTGVNLRFFNVVNQMSDLVDVLDIAPVRRALPAIKGFIPSIKNLEVSLDIRGDWPRFTAHRVGLQATMLHDASLQAEGRIERLDLLSGIEVGVRLSVPSSEGFFIDLTENSDYGLAFLDFAKEESGKTLPLTLTGRLVGNVLQKLELEIQEAELGSSKFFGNWTVGGLANNFGHYLSLQASDIKLSTVERNDYLSVISGLAIEEPINALLSSVSKVFSPAKIAFTISADELSYKDNNAEIKDLTMMGIFDEGKLQSLFSSGLSFGGSYQVYSNAEPNQLLFEGKNLDTGKAFNSLNLADYIDAESNIFIDSKEAGVANLAWLFEKGDIALPDVILGRMISKVESDTEEDNVANGAQFSGKLNCGIIVGSLEGGNIIKLDEAVLDSDLLLAVFNGDIDLLSNKYNLTMYPEGRSGLLSVMLPAKIQDDLGGHQRDTFQMARNDIDSAINANIKKALDVLGSKADDNGDLCEKVDVENSEVFSKIKEGMLEKSSQLSQDINASFNVAIDQDISDEDAYILLSKFFYDINRY